jgi:hypothetical protein
LLKGAALREAAYFKGHVAAVKLWALLQLCLEPFKGPPYLRDVATISDGFAPQTGIRKVHFVAHRNLEEELDVREGLVFSANSEIHVRRGRIHHESGR